MKFTHVALGFGVGISVGAGGAFLYFGKERPESARPPPAPAAPIRPKTPQPPPASSASPDIQYHPALKHGVPIADYLRFYTNFVSSFDARTRNPQWVIEYLTKETVNGPGNRKGSDFFEDRAIEERFRSKLSDYRRSGYDRGHMAPAANHKGTQQAMDDTFSLSNMSPQVGEGFNRDYWARFEQFVKQLTNRSDAVYVVTGPLYLPEQDAARNWRMNFPLIGKAPQLVAVPTHYYKVVLAESKGQEPAVGAFIMPNAPVDPSVPLKACVISLDMLESAAGVKFFPYALDAHQRKDLDAAAARISMEGRRQLGPAGGQKLLLAAVDQGSAPVPQPAFGTKARHLCDAVACQLPSEKFWLNAGNAAEAGPTARVLPPGGGKQA